jgi:hypothetical protein
MKKTLAGIAAGAILGATLTVGAAAAPAHASVPWEYKNALASAQSYVDMMDFSKKRLYGQLTSSYGEDFPARAAEYALKHVRVDYDHEALGAARSYRKTMHMSKSAIYRQLISAYGEKFTVSQGKWAIKHL